MSWQVASVALKLSELIVKYHCCSVWLTQLILNMLGLIFSNSRNRLANDFGWGVICGITLELALKTKLDIVYECQISDSDGWSELEWIYYEDRCFRPAGLRLMNGTVVRRDRGDSSVWQLFCWCTEWVKYQEKLKHKYNYDAKPICMCTWIMYEWNTERYGQSEFKTAEVKWD